MNRAGKPSELEASTVGAGDASTEALGDASALLAAARAVVDAFSSDEPLRIVVSGNEAAKRILALRREVEAAPTTPRDGTGAAWRGGA